jgi:hypothetical protein
MREASIIYVPIVECECGSRTLFGEGAERYDFVCRACAKHITGAIPDLREALTEATFRLRAATLSGRTQQEEDTLRKADAALAAGQQVADLCQSNGIAKDTSA